MIFSKIPEVLPALTGKNRDFSVSHTYVLLTIHDGKITEIARYWCNHSNARIAFAGTLHYLKYKGGDHYSALYNLLELAGFEFTESIRYDPVTVLSALAEEYLGVGNYHVVTVN